MDLTAKLAALRNADKKRTVFGAESHDYKLEPPLTARQLAAAEAQFGVTFPEDYRQFLLEVGAGGAGPEYGVFPPRARSACTTKAARCGTGWW